MSRFSHISVLLSSDSIPANFPAIQNLFWSTGMHVPVGTGSSRLVPAINRFVRGCSFVEQSGAPRRRGEARVQKWIHSSSFEGLKLAFFKINVL